MMKIVEGGVTAPMGYKAAGLRAGIKPNATKKDMAPENPEATTVSGFFRTPIFKCRQKDIFLC